MKTEQIPNVVRSVSLDVEYTTYEFQNGKMVEVDSRTERVTTEFSVPPPPEPRGHEKYAPGIETQTADASSLSQGDLQQLADCKHVLNEALEGAYDIGDDEPQTALLQSNLRCALSLLSSFLDRRPEYSDSLMNLRTYSKDELKL